MRSSVFRFRSVLVLLGLAAMLAACSTSRTDYSGPSSPHYKIGKPYKVKGRWYHPKEDNNYDRMGVASWYGRDFHGRRTANGETYDMNRLSAAHTTLPMPSMVEVTNLANGRKVVVRVNDRGPFADNRLIDLSREAARRLGFERAGLAKVRVRFVGLAPLHARAPKESPRIASGPARMSPNTAQPQRRSQRITLAQPQPAAQPRNDNAAAAAPETAIQPIAVAIPAGEAVQKLPAEARIAATPSPQTSAETDAAQQDRPLYLIRIAALSQLGNIEALKKQLESIGPLRLSRVESEAGSVFYRVNMGPFASLAAASESLDAVRRAGYSDAGLITLTE